MKYFNNDKDLKKQYREWVKKLHPDHGGDENAFKEMYSEYEEIQLNGFKKEAATNDIELSPELMEALKAVIHLEGLEIELVGSWIWISGDTYHSKEILKAAHYKWNNKRKRWFFATSKASGAFKGDFEELKKHHGYKEIKTKYAERIA